MKDILKPISEQAIVITGASSGIGLATAITAAHQGAKVLLVARSGETLQAVVDEIEDAGGCAELHVADVADRAALEAAAEQAIDRFGRIDTWVNNAGVAIYGHLEEVSDEDSRRLFETNFWGVVYGSLVALPHLLRSGGALVNLGSELSKAVLPLQGMYTASKHAVKGFTDVLRIEAELVDKAPVSISLIQPTAVDTPYAEHARNYMDREPKLPIPPIDPVRVAEAILKAASEGGRDIHVGATSNLNPLLSNLAPPLADRMAALMADRQQLPMPPVNPGGALHEAGGEGRVHGHPRAN
jgi:NADP-dependent 3-hydroxy acid dehydrogenase YdfG